MGLVSVTAAFRIEAIADDLEDEPAAVAAAKVSATDSAAISLSPNSPVSKKEGFEVARASWTSFMFGYPARTSEEENVAWFWWWWWWWWCF